MPVLSLPPPAPMLLTSGQRPAHLGSHTRHDVVQEGRLQDVRVQKLRLRSPRRSAVRSVASAASTGRAAVLKK
jgi:hypothetical protein